MTDPFHLSLRVSDLARSRTFYTRVLGCEVGREQPGWFDIDFFGHQVTLHQSAHPKARGPRRPRDERSLDHFGLHLDAERWRSLRARLEKARASFRVKPVVHAAGKPGETGKLVVVDPDGFGLEFKYGSPVAAVKERIVYVERDPGREGSGPAWIGRGVLSKSGRTVYFNGLALKRGPKGERPQHAGSHTCAESGARYWVADPRPDGEDRRRPGGEPVRVDQRVLAEYLALRGLDRLDPDRYQVASDVDDTDRERFHRLENTPREESPVAPAPPGDGSSD